MNECIKSQVVTYLQRFVDRDEELLFIYKNKINDRRKEEILKDINEYKQMIEIIKALE